MSESQGKLTPKQQAFVNEYLVDHNATAAAIRAGYSERTANREGSRLLSKVDIQEALQIAQQQQQQRTQITADRVVRECASLGLSDIGDILDFTGTEPRLRPACEIPESARRAISSVKVRRFVEGAVGTNGPYTRTVEVVEFKLWDKLSALDKLGKYLGVLKEPGNNTNVYINWDSIISGRQADPVEGRIAQIEASSNGHT